LIVRVLAAAHQPSGDETPGVCETEHPHQSNPNAPDGKNQLMMMAEEAISVVVGILVIARAVNILR
jgi:hypothetical protein